MILVSDEPKPVVRNLTEMESDEKESPPTIYTTVFFGSSETEFDKLNGTLVISRQPQNRSNNGDGKTYSSVTK